MNIAVLKAELDAGHPDNGPYDADDAVATDQANESNRTRLVPISSAELLAWSAGSGRLAKIKEAAANGPNDTIKSLADAAATMILRDGTSLDLNLQSRIDLVNALVSVGVLSNDDKTSLYTLATETISRSEELGLGRVRVGDVQRARR